LLLGRAACQQLVLLVFVIPLLLTLKRLGPVVANFLRRLVPIQQLGRCCCRRRLRSLGRIRRTTRRRILPLPLRDRKGRGARDDLNFGTVSLALRLLRLMIVRAHRVLVAGQQRSRNMGGGRKLMDDRLKVIVYTILYFLLDSESKLNALRFRIGPVSAEFVWPSPRQKKTEQVTDHAAVPRSQFVLGLRCCPLHSVSPWRERLLLDIR
jgi:hypothetical protein